MRAKRVITLVFTFLLALLIALVVWASDKGQPIEVDFGPPRCCRCGEKGWGGNTTYKQAVWYYTCESCCRAARDAHRKLRVYEVRFEELDAGGKL